jgi:hypothetical protein
MKNPPYLCGDIAIFRISFSMPCLPACLPNRRLPGQQPIRHFALHLPRPEQPRIRLLQLPLVQPPMQSRSMGVG